MRARDVVSFIVFAAMLAFGIGYIGTLGVRVGEPPHRTDLSMQLADVNGLVVNSNVMLRGVAIGKVSNIETAINGATVGFYIDDRFSVPVNSDVKLENLSALGESYIELVPRTGSGPMLRNGERIATKSVIQPPSISELATSVVRVLNQLDPDALRRIVGESDTALPDANSVLPNLTHTSKLLRNTAADMHGHGQELLDNFQTLLRNATWVGPVLATMTPLAADLGGVVGSLYSAFSYMNFVGPGPQGLYNLDRLLARIQALLDNNGGDLKVLGEALLPKMKGIAGALLNFDPSQILSNLLATVPTDGAITLHVAIPKS